MILLILLRPPPAMSEAECEERRQSPSDACNATGGQILPPLRTARAQTHVTDSVRGRFSATA
eukprot:1389753-Pyramimonas_sp.AAC.1